jgi:ABC transporter DrrB family efflux protein
MTAVTELGQSRPVAQPRGVLGQSLTIVWRNLVHIKRMPEMLLDVTIQPVMFVLLFAFVFGGSIAVPGESYREFLLPGIMVQTMTFASFVVAMGLTNDLEKGIVDRFRSLPISRSSILIGRSISSIIHSYIGIFVMSATGLAIGWGIHNGAAKALLAYLLLLLFGFAMVWVGIWVGSTFRSVEAVQGFMFTIMFPLTFVANTFAPTENMPEWLRVVAEWNPVSAVTAACRELWGNDGGLTAPPGTAWPLEHPEIATIIWSIIFCVIFAPLALIAFKRRASD